MIRLAVVGANGKMGSQVVNLAITNKDFELVCAVDKFGAGKQLSADVVVEDDLEAALVITKPDVVVDFTQPSSIYENVQTYIRLGIKSVIGTTGLTKEQVEHIEKLSKDNNVGVVIAPNFSIGAILMMKFAAEAAIYFNNGTSIKTAQMMIKNNDNFKLGNCAEVETIVGARGGEYQEDGKGKIQIHAVRMPGFVASQQVILGADGQVLKIHHDTINRECYMSGVALAVKHVYQNNQFIYGLENILWQKHYQTLPF